MRCHGRMPVFSAVLWIFLAASCGGRLPASLPMAANPVLTGGIGWIVVSEAYARVKAEPSGDAPGAGHLRGGEVLSVLARERDPTDGSLWYRISAGGVEGWLGYGQASFFTSRPAAERAAER
ncbi:MAG TPA: SH3 domain-containing protein, partial [Magnetospirillaceae bacterium]|nr:SH3 domain-containing protein [Magnetospirillaceae bacterium]